MTLPVHIAFSQKLPPTNCSLSASGSAPMSLADLRALASDKQLESIDNLPLGYASIYGDDSLRSAVAQFHNESNHHHDKFDFNNVLTFSGAQEALQAIYTNVLMPGDEVVVITPSYPSFVSMAESLACTVHKVALSEQNSWTIPVDDLLATINEKTKLIVLNSPNNPTGSYLSTDDIGRIIEKATQYRSYILSDDVSQNSILDDISLSHQIGDYDKGVIVSVMSKSFGLGGIRIGWMITHNQALLDSALAFKCQHSICTSKLDEQWALIALQHKHEIIERNNQILRENRLKFFEFVHHHKTQLNWQVPSAGIMSLVAVNTELSMHDWAFKIAEHGQVHLLPSELFGLEGKYFRLGLGQRDFEKTLDAFALALKAF